MPPQPQPTAGPAPAAGVYVEPLRNYNFLLDVPGVAQARFVECYGLGVRVHPIRYREGGRNQVVRSLPGPVEYADVTLRYGLTEARELWVWLTEGAAGRLQRKNVSITVLGPDGAREAIRWNLMNAWVSEWRGAQLDALGREAAIEEIRLVFDTLERG